MNGADLLEGFGGLEDDLLIRSRKKWSSGRRAGSDWKYAVAACLMILMGAAVIFAGTQEALWDRGAEESKESARGSNFSGNAMEASLENGSDEGLQEALEGSMMELEKELARPLNSSDIKQLVAQMGSGLELAAKAEHVSVAGHGARYVGIVTSDQASALLLEHAGEVVREEAAEEGRYQLRRLLGHDDLQYLISALETEEGLRAGLYEFDSFEEPDYSYGEVLESIYNIHGAEDIVKIIVSPASMDNTDQGRAIQEEIGTSYLEDKERIAEIYGMLCGLNRSGEETWEELGLFEEEGDPVNLREQVRRGRYLTLVTAGGMEIDSLKYTGISGRFYQYGGIVYDGLTREQAKRAEEIFGINDTVNGDDAASSVGLGEDAASRGADIPVDEENFHEARSYDAELEELQERISAAMVNQELSFVTTSAIRENPDRLHVTVNTREEEELAKLRAFDESGKWLEIEYADGQGILE